MPDTFFDRTLAELEANPFVSVLDMDGCIIDIEAQPGCGVIESTRAAFARDAGVIVTSIISEEIYDNRDFSEMIDLLRDLIYDTKNLVVFFEDIPEVFFEQNRALFDEFVNAAQEHGDAIINCRMYS